MKKLLLDRTYSVRLETCKNDTSKQWFVDVWAYNPETEKKERKKFYQGFTKCKTLSDKLNHGERLINEISAKLKLGWCPFDDKYYTPENNKENLTGNAVTKLLSEIKPDLRKRSFYSYNSHISFFLGWLSRNGLSDTLLKDFSKQNAIDFMGSVMSEKKITAVTRNTYLTNLKNIFNRLIDKGLIKDNPFSRIKKLKGDSKSAKSFDEEQRTQLRNLFKNEFPPLRLFTAFMFQTFIRPAELIGLKIGDIDFEKMQITVRDDISKNKKTQIVGINKDLMKLIIEFKLSEYPKTYFIFGKKGVVSPFSSSRNYFTMKHKEFTVKLGFAQGYTLYSWKHTGAFVAYQKNAKPEDMQKQMRHHSFDQTMTYLKSLQNETTGYFYEGSSGQEF